MKKVLIIVFIALISLSTFSEAQTTWQKVRSTDSEAYYVNSTSIKPSGVTVKFEEMGIYKYPKSISEKKFLEMHKAKNKTTKKASKPAPKAPITAESAIAAINQAKYAGEYIAKSNINLQKQAQVWQRPFKYYTSEKVVNCKTKNAYTYKVTTYNANKQIVNDVKYSDIKVPAYKEPIQPGSVNYWIMNKYCK